MTRLALVFSLNECVKEVEIASSPCNIESANFALCRSWCQSIAPSMYMVTSLIIFLSSDMEEFLRMGAVWLFSILYINVVDVARGCPL